MKNSNNWFLFAEEDLIVAQASLEKEIYNLACFHAQQGVEKLLKGFLISQRHEIPKTHSIGLLLKVCSNLDATFKLLDKTWIMLDNYYIPTRYPDALPGMLPDGMPNKDDAKKAITILEEVFKFILNKIPSTKT